MTNVLLAIATALLLANLIVLIWSLRRKIAIDLAPVQRAFDAVQSGHERTERAVRQEIATNREETTAASRQAREELGAMLKRFGDSLLGGVGEMSTAQQAQLGIFSERLDKLTQSNELKLGKLTESNEHRLEALRSIVEQRLQHILENNARQLDQMRQTVDEKLQGTLEKRLGESFKQVSERLEAVSRGLGEMQSLATGVGDLKKVLSNVKTRGTWGETQLGVMLEQVLLPDQYAVNVATKAGGERVEFAIKLPGRNGDRDEALLLPIDVKWPEEDYHRLLDSQERADGESAELAIRQLENWIKAQAKDICTKYINPPATTDFAILFLPTEGLFAEVVRRSGLTQFVQQNCNVIIAGPTTLWAILNSLQFGFKTLAIQQCSGEVWNLLAGVKTEFAKYGEVLVKVQKKLVEASDTLDKEVAVRARAINRKLRDVQELPTGESKPVLLLNGENGEAEEEEG